MGVPILKQGHCLIATLQAALIDTDLQGLRDELVAQVGRYRARGVIIDITALDVMDSFAVRTLRDIARMARLRGAETVIVGIQPEVALSMVERGPTGGGVNRALDREEGLACLEERTKGAKGGGEARAGGAGWRGATRRPPPRASTEGAHIGGPARRELDPGPLGRGHR